MPSRTVTRNACGSSKNPRAMMSRTTSRRISASSRVKPSSTSPWLMMPIRRPSQSTTGSDPRRCRYISRAASLVVAPARVVTAGLVITLAALAAAALRSPRRRIAASRPAVRPRPAF